MPNVKGVFSFALIQVALGGCGLFVPEKNPLSDDNAVPPQPSPQGMFEHNIVAHVRCEIRNGIWKALQLPNVGWLASYGATVTLKMSEEDQSALNPGISLMRPFENVIKTFPVGGSVVSPQSFSLGLGLSGTAHATRVETIQFTYSNKDLLVEAAEDVKAGITSCEGHQKGVMIESDLKIGQFIYDKAVIAGAAAEATTESPTTPPYSTFQDELTFVASYGGSVTPTWKFARITVDPNSPLLNALRANTNYLLITLGPVATPAKGKFQAQLTSDTQTVHNAALFGSSTASSIQSLTH
jgi:hypothetical protein